MRQLELTGEDRMGQARSSGDERRDAPGRQRLQGAGLLLALCAAAPLWMCATWSGRAAADDKRDCASAAESGQVLRRGGRTTEAIAQLQLCARPVCPPVIGADCMRFLAEAEQSLPTVVLRARDEQGRDLTDVTVTIDGVVVARQLDGRAVSLDPGMHRIRFEAEGRPAFEQTLVAVEGEKMRSFDVRLDATPSPAPPASARPVHPPAGAPPTATSSGPPTASWLLAGVGVAALGGFTYFGLTAKSERSDLEASCGVTRTCTTEQVDSFRNQALAADVLLGVGVASMGVAVLVWAFSDERKPTTEMVVAPQTRGGTLTLRGSF